MTGQVVIVGLGNPGLKYATTRHNAGFLVADELARRLGLDFQAGGDDYLAAVGRTGERSLTILKPLTYMNRSGRALEVWSQENMHSLPLGEGEGDTALPFSLLVVCDDLNLPLGSLRLRGKGASGGQNGLADIIETLGTHDFPRLRLGISSLAGPPDAARWADFVLTPFDDDERPLVKDMVDHAASACLAWLEHGTEYAASRHNRRPAQQTDPQESGS